MPIPEQIKVKLTVSELEEHVALHRILANWCRSSGDMDMMGRANRAARDLEEKLERETAVPRINADAEAERQRAAERVRVMVAGSASPDSRTRVVTQSGIGDIAWLIQAGLHDLPRQLGETVLLCPAGSGQRRAEDFVKLLPGFEFGGYFDTDDDTVLTIAMKEGVRDLKVLRGRTTFLSANPVINRGRSVAEVFDGVQPRYDLQLTTQDGDRAAARELLQGRNPARPFVVIYPAAYGPVRQWGFWGPEGWLEVADAVRADSNCEFGVVGAAFDSDMASALVKGLRKAGHTVYPCVGQPFGVAAEYLQRAGLLLAFPSGIPIVAALSGVRTIWWLPQDRPDEAQGGNVRNVTGWIPPDAEKAGEFLTRPFERPDLAAKAVVASAPFASLMRHFPSRRDRFETAAPAPEPPAPAPAPDAGVGKLKSSELLGLPTAGEMLTVAFGADEVAPVAEPSAGAPKPTGRPEKKRR